jgi:hypothetical protein
MTMFFREAGFAIATAAALALTAVPANATYFGSRDGPAIGIGTSCAALMENVARNINQSDDLLALHREAASAILAFRPRSLWREDLAAGACCWDRNGQSRRAESCVSEIPERHSLHRRGAGA